MTTITQNHPNTITVTANLVPYVRYSTHGQIAAVCESLKNAAEDHWGYSDRRARVGMSTAYHGALEHFDRKRALLDVLGWDWEADGKEVEVDLDQHADALHGAVSGEIEDLRENALADKDTPREVIEDYLQLADLLQILDAWLDREAVKA
jgi:hypothetical protein